MIDKLEFIIALAGEQHFGRAAETCNVSQPTLSAGIKQLEDMFGVLLGQRGSRFRGFTPEGERVLEWARRIVADTRAMRQEVDALKRGLAGHVQIAAVPSRCEPDEGEVNYPEIFATLDRLGYGKWVGCEYRPRARTEDGLGWARAYGIE